MMQPKKGSIELTIGPMFSGKSSWLIKKLNKLQKSGTPFLAIRYGKDNRYSKNAISSHNDAHLVAKSAYSVQDIRERLHKNPDITTLGIDEIQFFEPELQLLLQELKEKDLQIYVAGLDTDFLGERWETTDKIIEIADTVNTLTALCTICKKQATQTQRLIDGKPAGKSSPRILIGATESYTARCKKHHEIG